MPAGQMTRIIQQLRKSALPRDLGALTDAALLGAFLAHHDESAFEVFVRRHGPMVLGVCRRLLANAQDAEDAFQATFLVLVRKVASVVPREAVGNWLFGVAYRTALAARRASLRRMAKEKQMKEMPQTPVESEETWQEWRPLLDQELNRLPDKYRLPVVLCDLEGRTRREVARQLQIPDGTLSNRLAAARKLLAARLARRGVALSNGAIVTVLAQSGVLASLVGPTVKAASAIAARKAVGAATASARVAGLTEGVLKAMFLTKLRTVTAVLLLGIVAFAGVCLAQHSAVGQPGRVENKEPTSTGDQGEAEEGPRAPVFFALKKLDVKNRTLAVSLFGTNQAVENLPIAKDATILWTPSRPFSRRGPVWSIPPQEVRLMDLEPRLGRIDTPLTLDFAPDGKTVTGIMVYYDLSPGFLTGFDAQALTIKVSPLGGPLGVAFPPTEELQLPNDVEIIIGGKKGRLTDLRPGMIVELSGDADHVNTPENVPRTTTPRLFTSLKKFGPFARIEAYRPLIAATVEGVEPEKKTLTVKLDSTTLVFENLPVAEDVKVVIDGRQRKLADLKKGTHVVLELRGETSAPRERRIVTIENSTKAGTHPQPGSSAAHGGLQ